MLLEMFPVNIATTKLWIRHWYFWHFVFLRFLLKMELTGINRRYCVSLFISAFAKIYGLKTNIGLFYYLYVSPYLIPVFQNRKSGGLHSVSCKYKWPFLALQNPSKTKKTKQAQLARWWTIEGRRRWNERHSPCTCKFKICSFSSQGAILIN